MTYFDGYVLWGFHNSYSSQSSMLGVAGFDPSDIANTYFSVLGEDMGLPESYGSAGGGASVLDRSIIIGNYLVLLWDYTLYVYSSVQDIINGDVVKTYTFDEEYVKFSFHQSMQMNNLYVFICSSYYTGELRTIKINKQDLLNWIES